MVRRSPPLASLGVVASLLGFGPVGCLTEVPKIKACGDGYIDFHAGEECDPHADPVELRDLAGDACAANGLPRGEALCDPQTCRFTATPFECSVCGDGFTQGYEDCDNSAPPFMCADGKTPLGCTDSCTADFSNCPTCGNGILDSAENEECEYNINFSGGGDGGPGIVGVVSCRDLPVFADLPASKSQPNEPPGQPIHYTNGDVALDACDDTCFFPRNYCNFCRDGELDGAYNDRVNGILIPRPAELCEEGVDSEHMINRCREWCGAASDVVVTCDYECNADCSDGHLTFEGDWGSAQPIEELGCCLPAGEPCNPNGPPVGVFPCCKGLKNPEGGNGCDSPILNSEGQTLWACG